MQLRGYIALEFLTGIALLSGLTLGGLVLSGVVDVGLPSSEAQAALPSSGTGSELAVRGNEARSQNLTALRASRTEVVPPASKIPETEIEEAISLDASVPDTATGSFGGVPDEELLGPLRDSKIASVRFNKGGSSISLRLDFENGARAAFKPKQVNWQSVPRREVVAYRINRLLGLSSVPPAIGRRFEARSLLASLDSSSTGFRPRLRAEIVQKSGWVSGEISWWIPVIRRAKIDGFDIDSMEGIVSWKRYLRVNSKMPNKSRDLLMQISDMVLFDFVINNPDRWSGGNARVSENGSELYFMDNTMSFGKSKTGNRKTRIYFQRCQVFSRELVSRLRELDEETVRREIGRDVEPFPYLLDDAEIVALLARRDSALVYLDSLIAKYGEEKVLAFP